MSDKYMLFVLGNGAELIGKIDAMSYDGADVVIEHPLVIRPIQKGPNQYALDLFPHSLANPEGKHKFSRSMMVSESQEIPDMLERAYIERTSKIVLSHALDDLEKRA